jgi:SAM-dependent methyltransferase
MGAAGYRVTGVDTDREAVDAARARGGANVDFVPWNMKDLALLPGTFDGALSMWQSFGYLDSAGNLGVLRAIRDRLRPGGRFVLDLYNRRFFESRQGGRRLERGGAVVEEHTELRGGRLLVTLRYAESEASDRFDWEVFDAEEIVRRAAEAGLSPLIRCREFDESLPVSDDFARMQLVFERG